MALGGADWAVELGNESAAIEVTAAHGGGGYPPTAATK